MRRDSKTWTAVDDELAWGELCVLGVMLENEVAPTHIWERHSHVYVKAARAHESPGQDGAVGC